MSEHFTVQLVNGKCSVCVCSVYFELTAEWLFHTFHFSLTFLVVAVTLGLCVCCV